MSRVIFTGRETPEVPATNKIQLYAKTDGKLYYMADDGVEVEVGGSSVLVDSIHVHNKYADISTTVGPDQSILAYEEYEIRSGAVVEFGTNSELVILTDASGGGGTPITLPLALAEGGTGETTAEDALVALGGVPLDSFTALGDLIAGTGAGTTITLPAGTNGQLLSANDTEPSGLEWVDPPSGGASSHSALTELAWEDSGHTAPSVAVAAFDPTGAAAVVAPGPGYLVLTSKDGFLSWAPYALGLAFSLSAGPDSLPMVFGYPITFTTGAFS